MSAGLCFINRFTVIPNRNAQSTVPFNDPAYKNPTDTQIWAFEASLCSYQLALLTGLTTEMQNKVTPLSRPEWQKRVGALHDSIKVAYEQAKNLCAAVDPANFKEQKPPT